MVPNCPHPASRRTSGLVIFTFQMTLIFLPYVLHAQPIVFQIISTLNQYLVNHGVEINYIYTRPMITSNFGVQLSF